ncbi:MAG: DEAD/DEAH box helicase family protein, partial [Bacilli bacterium]|nr:DEAD/DEAH box helicase family protein [Bacilli bacterium]
DYPTYHKLLDQAIKVKNLSIFEDIEIPKYDHFLPFQYQIDSVKTMLEKYEGKGVFGDQVGLGKTVQTLITADVMFQRNEISNMVVVAPKVLVDQWKNEIETKFNGVFHIVNREGVTNKMENLNLLSDPAQCSSDKLNILFIDTNAFRDTCALSREQTARQNIREKEDQIEELKGYIEAFEKEIAREKEDPQTKRLVGIYSLAGISLEDAFDRIPEIANRKAAIAKAYQDIEETQKEIETINENRLFNRQIDLLAIDESHSVIDSINESRYRDVFYGLGKKYCVLLSATPIERSLDDIFYLIKFVAGNRFSTIDDFHDYVEARSLSELVTNERSRERLNGLINSLFTRKRLRDSYVMESLMPQADLAELASFIDGQKDRIPGMQDMSEEAVEAERERIALALDEYSLPLRQAFNLPSQRIPSLNYITNDLTVILNSYLIAYYLKTNDRTVYPYIRWAPAKRGVQFHYHNSSNRHAMEKEEIFETILGPKILGNPVANFSRMVIYVLSNSGKIDLFQKIAQNYPDRKVLVDLSIPAMKDLLSGRIGPTGCKGFRSVSSILQYFLPMMHLNPNDADSLLSDIQTAENRINPQNGLETLNMLYKNFILDQFHNDPNGNAVFIVDRTRLEGSDLHAASNFVLCQTHGYDPDSHTYPIIKPLALEQFIGRVYRIGQTANVDIHVFPSNQTEGLLFDTVYCDPEGLDLFGEERIETGFVVPILEDAFRQDLILTFGISQTQTNRMGFIELYRRYKELNEMDRFLGKTREICTQFRIGEQGG